MLHGDSFERSSVEGEEIRWSGRPKPFGLLDKALRPSIMLTWISSAVVLLAVAVILHSAMISAARPLPDMLMLAAVAMFLPIILSLRPFLDKRCLEENTIYAITSHRIIAIVRDEPMYIPLGKGMQVAVDAQEDGCGNLCFGETVGAPAKKSRSHAVTGIRATTSATTCWACCSTTWTSPSSCSTT